MTSEQSTAGLELAGDGSTLICHGCWTISSVNDLNHALQKLRKDNPKISKIDGSGIDGFDSAGAMLLRELRQTLGLEDRSAIEGLKKRYAMLYEAVSKRLAGINKTESKSRANWFYTLGVGTIGKLLQIIEFISFTGELTVLLLQGILRPHRLPWRDLVGVMEETGYKALGIIALMTFLIGVVLAYQLADQLKQYGADIFIVDVTGIAILREFAPLITAVIMAGRTSTAFAALIGTMIVNEEVDALRTMGVQPIQRLVIPRVVALIITLPLLVIWADVFGVLGSMVMAKSILHIGFSAFLDRFDLAVSLKHYVLGLIKTPIFALIIAGVGCFQGFSVKLSAESVGKQTTKAAVQSIFLIIIADALFSVIYSMMDL